MNEELKFAKTLEEICALAGQQGGVIREEQEKERMEGAGIDLGESQLSLVYEYLKSRKIGIGEPADPFDYLTRDEIDYLEAYLKETEALADVSDGEKEAVALSAMAGDPDARRRLIEIFLPQVAQIARLYAGQGVYLEDLIGEGNVALTMAVEMLDCAENAQDAFGSIASAIMEAMETYIAENVSQKKTGDRLAQKANDVLDQARELAEELGRKVTVQELAEESGMTADQIREAVRITADHIDYLDTKG